MESIYNIISANLIGGSILPDDFNILRIVKGEEYPAPKDDGVDREFTDDGVRQGEFDAVVSRLPRRFTQHLLINFRIARVLKKGINAYCSLKAGSLDAKGMAKAEKKVKAAKAIIDKYETITIADKVLSQVDHLKTPRDRIAEFGRYLAKEGTSVQNVKLGLAMIGFFGKYADKELVLTLGKSEELTHFAVKALSIIVKEEPDLCDCLIELAKATRGWGKVAAILELPDKIKSQESKDWLLAHGNENTLGLYILAVEAAIKGDLDGRLTDAVNEKKPISEEVSKGILNIIEGLFQAEKIQGADSFSEVPNVGTLLSTFAFCVKGGLITGENAQLMVDKLTEKKFIRSRE